MKLGTLFGKGIESDILSSVMPGGKKWKAFIKDGEDCLKHCPAYCSNGGPSRVCTSSWSKAPANKKTLLVLNHVFQNFEYYDRGDSLVLKLPEHKIEKEVGRIRRKCAEILDKIEKSEKGIEGYAARKVRSNQHKFREKLLRYWEETCAVTGIKDKDLLVASHIKPWSISTPREKLDKFNGLLLNPILDFLFDIGFITFRSHDGGIIISSRIRDFLQIFGLRRDMHLKKVDQKHKPYLDCHREIRFQK
jgi:hypothetical protein